MDIISAYREVGTYRGAAMISGTTHKTGRGFAMSGQVWS